MRLSSREEIVLESRFTYNSNYSSLSTLEELHFRVKVNTLCSSRSIKDAAEILKVSPPLLTRFLNTHNLSSQHLKLMRQDYIDRFGGIGVKKIVNKR